MSNKEFDAQGEIESIRLENALRDKIALQALIRVAALEKALMDKGVLNDEEVASNLALVTAEVIENVKQVTGQTTEK